MTLRTIIAALLLCASVASAGWLQWYETAGAARRGGVTGPMPTNDAAWFGTVTAISATTNADYYPVRAFNRSGLSQTTNLFTATHTQEPLAGSSWLNGSETITSEYLQADFGSAKYITRLLVWNYYQAVPYDNRWIKKAHIDVSTNASTWTRIFTNRTFVNTGGGVAETVQISNTLRYIKFVMVENGGGNRIGLAEVIPYTNGF